MTHLQWADDYRALYLWALRMAEEARARGDEHTARKWEAEANQLEDKRIEHIMAQDNQQKGPRI